MKIYHIFFALLITLSSCSYDKYDELHPPVSITDSITRTVSYKYDITPIISAHCYRCHGVDASKGGQFHLNSYSGLAFWATPHDSTCQLIESLTRRNTSSANYMPNDSAKISDVEILRIYTWVKQGSKDN